MRGFADHCRIVTIRNDQSGYTGQVALLIEDSREVRRYRPVKTVAIIEIVEPLAVSEKVGLGDLDLDDREAAAAVERHQIGTPTIGQRHFTDGEAILAAEQPGHAPSDVGRDWRNVSETQGLGLAGHRPRLEQSANAANPWER